MERRREGWREKKRKETGQKRGEVTLRLWGIDEGRWRIGRRKEQ